MWPSATTMSRSRSRRTRGTREVSSTSRPIPGANSKTRKSRVVEVKGTSSSRSEEHTSELQSQSNLVCRLLLEKKKKKTILQRQGHNHTVTATFALDFVL